MRIVVDSSVKADAQHQFQGYLLAAASAFLAAAAGKSARSSNSWDEIALLVGIPFVAACIFGIVTVKIRRDRLRVAIEATHGDWVGVIQATPDSIRPLGDPTPPANWARWWTTDMGQSKLTCFVVVDGDSLRLEYPQHWGRIPDMRLNASDIDELRFSLDGNGRPRYLALVKGEHSACYKLRPPIPDQIPSVPEMLERRS